MEAKARERTAYGTLVGGLALLSVLAIQGIPLSLSGQESDIDTADVFCHSVNVWKRMSTAEFRGLLASRAGRDVIDDYNMRETWFVGVDEEERERGTRVRKVGW
jgi:hypothetical protein